MRWPTRRPASAAGLGRSLQRWGPGGLWKRPRELGWSAPYRRPDQPLGPRPTITALSLWPSVRVSFLAAPGLACLLEYKEHLTDPNWTPIPPIVIGTAGVLTLTDTNSVTTQRFYRIGVR